MTNELYHHGILGQKWGIRRYQNSDGTLTTAGKARYGSTIQKMEKDAIASEYKRSRKNGGGFVFKSARMSTGENYNKANLNFDKVVSSDKKYKELSKKAFNAEKERLMYEKSAKGDDDAYEKLINSKEYMALDKKSEKATREKNKRLEELAKDYVDVIKEAKLDDLKITGPERKKAKDYISDRFDDFYWDDNLEYNVDNYYEPWVDKARFKE